ncbi:M4 family metallopeptidase [Geothrix fermentans]|jgi:Zn-dependent metalloprotease|uniref:M4 family metallopeptidase n=1 Tax=Geothrix fermentans TaxID=44676 RepID=UPI00041EA79A|nr:M4 family metallopeptidase [Geothrix fermentans]
MRSVVPFLLPAFLLAAPPDQARTDALAREARGHLLARAFEMGLGPDLGLAFRGRSADALGEDHVRLDQTYKGVPVLEGEAIVHFRNGRVRAVTDDLVRGLALSVEPIVGKAEALAAAHGALAPRGAYAHEPSAELVIASLDPEGPGRARAALAYHVHTELENGAGETKHTDFLVDAHTGRILESWDTLHTAGATGTGASQWYGTVSLSTNGTGTGYELRDTTRGTSGRFGNNVTTNLLNGTSGAGTIFTDADNAWGDGLQYDGTPGMGANAQTAGVDGHRGMQATWDFYLNVFSRNGIDDAGTATFSRMHYSSQYDNAFWSDSCFCMTYGDGQVGGSVGEADLDTAGHEMSHGVCAATANLVYRKESGGLNEANSDIFGTLVEFYTLNNSTGSFIPSTAGPGPITANYKLFENSWGHAYPNEALRWMYKPSRDGRSPDFYSSTIGRLDVHYSSGVANHFFFLLAHGSQVDSFSDNLGSPMTNGVTSITGIGNDKAGRIWYRALTTYMTKRTNYAGARVATLNAAADLYGAGSTEYATVNTAWLAVNVK